MGKKNKSKSKATTASSAATTQQNKKGSPVSLSSKSAARIDAANAAVFQSQLDKDELCKQFDSLIESSPEEGIQAVRDLYLLVLKKKLNNQRTVKFLRNKKESLRTDVGRCKELISEETAAYDKANSQKDKLQSLSDGLTRKKESLLLEVRAAADSEKKEQQERTSELIGETQGISAKLERYSVMREEYAAENNRLKDKLRVVLDDYSNQEESFNAALEAQVAKIAAASQKFEGQSEQLEKEVQGREELEKSLTAVLQEEESLKGEVREKSSRFEEFQDSLTRSNECFQEFKTRMEEKTEVIAALERDNKQLAVKKDKTEVTIREMTAEIVVSRQSAFDVTQRQIDKLTSLCAAMEKEIAELTAEQTA
jgi:chromosome segregation ATPase